MTPLKKPRVNRGLFKTFGLTRKLTSSKPEKLRWPAPLPQKPQYGGREERAHYKRRLAACQGKIDMNGGRIPPNEIWDQGAWLQYFDRKDWETVLKYLDKLGVKPVQLSRQTMCYVPTNHVIAAIEKAARDQL